jgi:predicted alpha/beta superfamily hydrolase
MNKSPALLLPFLLAVAGCAHDLSASAPASALTVRGEARIANTQVFDLRSSINGRNYRIMVGTPPSMEAAMKYPVLYVLDGNQYFATATDAVNRQSYSKEVLPAIVVGIGYPADDYSIFTSTRNVDLTPSPSSIPQVRGEFGGADAFSRVLEEEIRPLIEARYPVDSTRQVLWGQSYAGLFVLRTLFLHPESFSHFALSSPSIWWNRGEVLALEPEFLKTVQAKKVRPTVLITSAGDEQYRGNNPKRRAEADFARMVDNASELASRLESRSGGLVTVSRVIFDGEVHNTVPPASLSRTLRFALSRPAATR